ncbi:MAG: PAS domain-containing protein, partial [Promethearchaeota archaeon]
MNYKIKADKLEINWRSLVEHSSQRIMTLDRNGIILSINRNSPNRNIEDDIGKSVYNFLPTDEQERVHKILHEVFQTGKPHKYISKIIRENGSEVWYENNVAGIKENGKIIAAIINSTDITELKLYELKLKESEKQYRNLINKLTDVVIEIDFEGNISYISSQITHILGYTPEELIGTNGFQFIHPNDLEEMIKKHENAIKAEIPIYYEYKARHKYGHYVPMSLHVNYLKIGDKGKIIGILRDDSEKKATEERLREAEEKYRN